MARPRRPGNNRNVAAPCKRTSRPALEMLESRITPAAVKPPSVSVDDVAITEGDAGTKPLTLTFHLSAPSTQTVGFDYDTFGGSAKAGTDYNAFSGSSSFTPGQTLRTVTVSNVIRGNFDSDADRAFKVRL